MKNYTLLFVTIIGAFSFSCYAQQTKINSADKKYDSYAYVDAIKTYEKVAAKGYKSEDMFKKLSKWADDDFRSVNGQIEMILDKALKDAGRKAVQKEQVSSKNSKLLK